jgi:hypothetical protein
MVVYDARPSQFNQLSTTSEWEYLLATAGINDGIDAVNSPGFPISLDTGGRNIVTGAGNVVIKGQLWRSDASISTPIPAASASNRIDRLVFRYNRTATTSPTVISPTVITGTPSGSPVLPPIVQGPTGIYDIPVCHWTSASNGGLSGLIDDRQYCLDTWHNFPAPPSGLTTNGTCRYRMRDPRRVELQFMYTVASGMASGTIYFFTLPNNYTPQNQQRTGGLGIFTRAGGNTVNVLNYRLAFDVTGLLMVLGFAGGADITELSWQGSFALD